MSLRRKSCNACFQGRRKCDLAFPVCQRCKRTGKNCQYIREQSLTTTEFSNPTLTSADVLTDPKEIMFTNGSVLGLATPSQDTLNGSLLDVDLQDIDFDFAIPAFPPVAPSLLGELGYVQPLNGNVESWQWVADRLRECPRDFAKMGENMFIHRSMYCLQSPLAIKTAFGICTASQMVTPATEAIFIGSLEEEVGTLLKNVAVKGITDGLARLQVMVLYQILRLFFGNVKQQCAAELHKSITNTWALQLLQQTHINLSDPQTREDLTLAESVRRTVMVTYIVHALGSLFKHGVCTEMPTLMLLPVSVDSELWRSSDGSCPLSADGDLGTMKYAEWTDMWVAAPQRRRLDPFQKMLMVACKGKAKVEEVEAEMV